MAKPLLQGFGGGPLDIVPTLPRSSYRDSEEPTIESLIARNNAELCNLVPDLFSDRGHQDEVPCKRQSTYDLTHCPTFALYFSSSFTIPKPLILSPLSEQ